MLSATKQAVFVCLIAFASVTLAAGQGGMQGQDKQSGGMMNGDSNMGMMNNGSGMGMHQHMQNMQQTMQQFHGAQNSEERMRLMNKHMNQMQQTLSQMHSGDGQGMQNQNMGAMMQQMMEHMAAQQRQIEHLHQGQ